MQCNVMTGADSLIKPCSVSRATGWSSIVIIVVIIILTVSKYYYIATMTDWSQCSEALSWAVRDAVIDSRQWNKQHPPSSPPAYNSLLCRRTINSINYCPLALSLVERNYCVSCVANIRPWDQIVSRLKSLSAAFITHDYMCPALPDVQPTGVYSNISVIFTTGRPTDQFPGKFQMDNWTNISATGCRIHSVFGSFFRGRRIEWRTHVAFTGWAFFSVWFSSLVRRIIFAIFVYFFIKRLRASSVDASSFCCYANKLWFRHDGWIRVTMNAVWFTICMWRNTAGVPKELWKCF